MLEYLLEFFLTNPKVIRSFFEFKNVASLLADFYLYNFEHSFTPFAIFGSDRLQDMFFVETVVELTQHTLLAAL